MSRVRQLNAGVVHNVAYLPFQASNVPDAAGNAKAVEASSNEYVALRDGSIIGLSVRHNADLTGGSITWRITINGTASTLLTVLTDDTHQQALKTIDGRKLTFKAGDLIGVDWTKSGTVAPTTTDVSILVEALMEGVRY